MHEPELRRQGVDIGDDRERQVVEPDIFAQGLAGVVRLRDQVPGEVVEIVRRARRRHVLRGAEREPLQPVIDVVRGDRRADRQPVEPAAVVIAVVVGRADAVVGADAAGAVMREGADIGALRDGGELVAGRGIGVGPSRPG